MSVPAVSGAVSGESPAGSTLFRGGSVYAPGAPRATAMLVHGTEIAWIGTDAAADRLGRTDVSVDLSGALVAPAFVDAHVRWPDTALDLGPAGEGDPAAALRTLCGRAAVRGVASLHVMATEDPSALSGSSPPQPGPEVLLYRPRSARHAEDAFRDATAAGTQAVLLVEDTDGLDTVLAVARRLAGQVGLASVVGARHRVEIAAPAAGELLADDAAFGEMARLGFVASVQPVPAERARRAEGQSPPALHALAAAGVPLAFGAGLADPWEAVRLASWAAWGEQALSVRAAFAAATRGGRRAARQDREGVLRPGAPATFAVWTHPGELVVRTPDARVSAWSTDPRAATPGLPDLTGEGPGPVCRRTVVRGVVVHDDGSLSGAGG